MNNTYVYALIAAVTLAPATALAQSPTTTRIETRPFYGATVTLEEGVRVFRPLPPHQRVIINPNGAASVSLGFEEKRSVSHNHHYGEGTGGSAAAYAGGVSGWAPQGHGRKGRHGGHDRGGVLSPGGQGHGGHGGHGGHR